MSTGGKIVVTLGIASSALFAAWLLTGNRKEKAKQLVARSMSKSKKTNAMRDAIKMRKITASEDQEVYYI